MFTKFNRTVAVLAFLSLSLILFNVTQANVERQISFPISGNMVQAGTLIPVTLVTQIGNTSAGNVVVQVRSNVYDTTTSENLLIPKGSKLLGQSFSREIQSGQCQILIIFDRIIRPDGSSILLSRHGDVDLFETSGFKDNSGNHWARILGAAPISTVISIAAGRVVEHSEGGDELPKPSMSLSKGYQFNVAVKKDIVITPYRSE